MIDNNLLEEAYAALGTETVRDIVEAALREAIRKHLLEELRRSLGKVDLDLTSEDLCRLRSER